MVVNNIIFKGLGVPQRGHSEDKILVVYIICQNKLNVKKNHEIKKSVLTNQKSPLGVTAPTPPTDKVYSPDGTYLSTVQDLKWVCG